MRNARMLRRCLWPGLGTLAVLGLAATLTNFGSVRADKLNQPPFDFADDYYLQNGVEPTGILMRVGNADRNPNHWVIDSANADPTRNSVRVLETTGGFNASGTLIYYSIMGMLTPDSFTADAAGNRAQQIANAFRAFLFPRKQPDGTFKLDPGLPNRRQDNVFDTRNGYFSNNPLGLWILSFVVYTDKAFTPEGQKVLAPIAATNGTDLDGTPILKTADLIDNLTQQGLVELRTRPLDGSQGFPWVI